MTMTLRRWLPAAALVAGGCASTMTTRVSEGDVSRLPAHDQQQIVVAGNQQMAASAQVAVARRRGDEARQFRRVALDEQTAARARLEAARETIILAHSTRDTQQLTAAQRNEDVARDEMMATRAKLDYADRLVALRDAQLDGADAGVRLARADTHYRKAELVIQAGVNPNIDLTRIGRERDEAQAQLAQTRLRVAALQGEAQQLRMAWSDRRRELNTAARDLPAQPIAPRP
jgi:hypothetical protein